MVWTYFYNILVLLSIKVNVLFGGSPHESLSMRVGRKYYTEEKRNRWITFQHDAINWLFFWEDNHVLDAIDGENMAGDLWDGWKR